MVKLEVPHFSTAAPLGATRLTFQPPFTVIQKLWNRRDDMKPWVSIPDVAKKRSYVTIDRKVRSELAALMVLDGRAVRVLNVESEHPGYFDEQDIERIQHLARFAALAVALADENAVQRSTLAALLEGHLDEREGLRSILSRLNDQFGLDAGVIFIPETVNGENRSH